MNRRLASYSALKENTRQQILGESWWVTSFLHIMQGNADPRMVKGRRLAERGQIILSSPYPGGVDAVALGAVGGSPNVSLWLNDLTDSWDNIYKTLAKHPDLYQSLLSGSYLKELDDLFKEVGVNIIPDSLDDLDFRCDCSSVYICSHVIGTYITVGARLHEDPLLLFLLHGKTREEIITGVNAYLQGSPSAEVIEERKKDQAENGEIFIDPETYYDPGPELAKIKIRLDPSGGNELDIITRLGPSPFKVGKKNLSDFIKDMYTPASQYTWELMHSQLKQ